MTRTSHLVAAAFVLLATPLYAQPRVDHPTGLNPPAGLGSEQLIDYLKAMRTASTSFEIETRGETRKAFGAQRIQIDATWARKPGSDGPVLTSATIRPTAGGRLKLGDEEINKLTINSKGEITIDRKGIDVTVYKITRKANGDLVLDMPWWAFGDKTIKAADVPFDIKEWPPELQSLVEALMNPKSGGSTTTRHEARVDWNISGQADAHTFPFKGGSLNAATNFSLRGAGELRPDGSFQTIGDNNRAVLELKVGRDNNYTHGNGNLALDVAKGTTARFEGRYGIYVPGGNKPFSMEVDGRVNYDLKANKITMNVPSGPRLRVASGSFDGSGRLVGSIGPAGSSMVLRDGTYNIALNGPMSINGLSAGEFKLEDLQFDGGITSSGKLEELSADRLALNGGWEGSARGLTARVAGQDGAGQLRFLPGSDLTFKADSGRVDARLSGSDNRNPTGIAMSADGVHVEGDIKLADVRANKGPVGADLNQVNLKLSADGDLNTRPDADGNVIRNVRGRVDAEVVGGGTLSMDGLPGAPVLPAGQRKHTVAAGDTLHNIARRYGVPVDQLKAANGIPADSSLIRVGQELQIPGGANMRAPLAADPQGRGTTNVENGSKATIELTNGSVGRDGRVRVQGFVSSQVRLRDVDLRSSTLVAHILGAAQATLPRTAFSYDSQSGLTLDKVTVPVRIDLSKGSRVTTKTTSPGREMDIQFDRDGSYAEFSVVVERGQDGKLRIPELQKIDLLLHSNSAAQFAGEVVDVSGQKSIRYTGRMAFLPNGIDFYGNISVTVSGDDSTPAVRIRW
ncbi:MAG: LysM peptidoglycan-binding domain-containing protein [Planctomycetota bacterium]